MPILDEHTLDFISNSPEQTRRLGARLGALLRPGDVIAVQGELGTGKTCLAQGVGAGIGILEPITSPTFTLIAEYTPPPPAPPLYHIDVYRLVDPVNEVRDLGLDEYLLGDGVCFIEWADRIDAALPAELLGISLRHLNTSKRGILVRASGSRYDELLKTFKRDAFGVYRKT